MSESVNYVRSKTKYLEKLQKDKTDKASKS